MLLSTSWRPPPHTCLVPGRQSCWQPWEGLGEKRDGDGEEQRKGKEEGRFLYGNMGEGQKGQERNDSRRSKLQQEQRQLMALPDRGDTSEHWGGTSLTHGHIQSVQLQRRGENGRIEVLQQKIQ